MRVRDEPARLRVLIINFEMNPDSAVLAWQPRVARELAARCEEVIVLTESAPDCSWPANMLVREIPKLPQRAPLRWLGGRLWLNGWIWSICRRHGIDACFVHMNMRWAYLAAPAFRLANVPVLLWYAHGTVTDRLRQAHAAVARVVTSTPEGFRLASNKVVVIGQGVDTALFALQPRVWGACDIITVGRISRRKRLERIIDVMDALWGREPGSPIRLHIVGSAITSDDRTYLEELRTRIARCAKPAQVICSGHVPMDRIPQLYRTAFLHLNLSETGSMDKTVIESLAVGCPVLTSNEAFTSLLGEYPEMLVSKDASAVEIAERLRQAFRRASSVSPEQLRALVVGAHDQTSYIDSIHLHLREIATH